MTPSRKYRHLKIKKPPEITTGVDAFLDHCAGWLRRLPFSRIRLALRARSTFRRSRKYQALSLEQLQQQLEAKRILIRRSGCLPRSEQIDALALIGAAAKHALGLSPYQVQYMASLTLLDGKLAEMATGEGKTLSTGLAAVALGWTGKPLHVLTSNDYLAERDASELKPLFSLCRVTVGFINQAMAPPRRTESYAQDIVYTTAKDLLADFLRDRLLAPGINDNERLLALDLNQPPSGTEPRQRVLRGLHSALVDEADSVLIDEAVTPLIISQKYKNESFNECCRIANEIAASLHEPKDFHVDFRRRRIKLTQKGIESIRSQSAKLPVMWRSFERSQELVELAINARVFYQLNKDYIIVDGKVVIVDQNTGRQKVDSSWRGGVHQAVEIKEGLEISDATRTLASMTFQCFFRLYHHLGATTGTVANSAPEFWHVYKLPYVRIPTHRKCVRTHHGTRYFATVAEKWEAVTAAVEKIHSSGQPLLVGTDSVEASLELAEKLKAIPLAFHLLNASEHAEEAEIIKKAGTKGAITIATNMAGRGTDIKLAPGVAELGGLFVVACSRMESQRVDRQLYGRAGRQGDPGMAECFVSLEDRLIVQKHSATVLAAAKNLLSTKVPGANSVASYLTNKAQRRAEHLARQQRHSMVRSDKWLKESLTFSGSNI